MPHKLTLWAPIILTLVMLIPGCSDGTSEEPINDVVLLDANDGSDAPLDGLDTPGDVPDTSVDMAEDGSPCFTAPQLESIEDWQPRPDRVPLNGTTVITTAEQFLNVFGEDAPDSIDFSDSFVLFQQTGHQWFGAVTTIQSYEYCGDDSRRLTIETSTVLPGDNCSLLPLRSDDWAAQAVGIAAKSQVPEDLGLIRVDQNDSEFDCAETGAALNAACSAGSLCLPGLLCAGLTTGPEGVCVSASNVYEFTQRVNTPIPDLGTVDLSNPVDGVAGTTRDVVVRAEVDHVFWQQLRLTVIAPDGTVAEIPQRVDSFPTGRALALPELVGVPANGEWLLQVEDTKAGNVGEIISFDILLTSD